MTEETAFQAGRDKLRESLCKYTRKAFHMLPKMKEPRILDIGCGSGVPTMELARLSDGQITGLDIDQSLLDRLTVKVEAAGLSDRVRTVKYSMLDMDFPDESFDIIWAEGSIAAIGFKKGLEEWRRFLRPDGFLVVHDEIGGITEKLERIPGCGYELVDYFLISEDIWWSDCYAPLEQMIDEIRTEYPDNPEALEEPEKDRRFIEVFKKNPKPYGSVFFIMKKVEGSRTT